MGGKIAYIGASTNWKPEQALADATQFDLTDVLIIGVDQDDDLVIRSSHMSREWANWLLDRAKFYVHKFEGESPGHSGSDMAG